MITKVNDWWQDKHNAWTATRDAAVKLVEDLGERVLHDCLDVRPGSRTSFEQLSALEATEQDEVAQEVPSHNSPERTAHTSRAALGTHDGNTTMPPSIQSDERKYGATIPQKRKAVEVIDLCDP